MICVMGLSCQAVRTRYTLLEVFARILQKQGTDLRIVEIGGSELVDHKADAGFFS